MTIRLARDPDWPAIAHLADDLIDAHHRFDPSRFIPRDALSGDSYTTNVRAELAHGRATVFVAEDDGRVVGFVFVGVETESWKELRPEAGFIHDIVVHAGRRNAGIGRALLTTAIDWLAARGVERVMLWSAHANTGAQRLFASHGFHPTMVEMTRRG